MVVGPVFLSNTCLFFQKGELWFVDWMAHYDSFINIPNVKLNFSFKFFEVVKKKNQITREDFGVNII